MPDVSVDYRATYNSWAAMRQRCKHAYRHNFHRYGGRGINICERWDKFPNFLEDMGERPDGMTLERKDNNIGYEPSNCIWATQKEQQNNRRNNRILKINGVEKTVAQWSEETGLHRATIMGRIKRGWSEDRILSDPSGGSTPKSYEKTVSTGSCDHGKGIL